MKYLLLPVLVFSAFVYAQTPQQLPAPSATPLAPAKDDAVVGKIGDKPLTAGDVRRMTIDLPPNVQEQIMRDAKHGLEQLMLLQYLRDEAEKEKLAEASPFKEQLEFDRMRVLAQAAIQHHNDQITVPLDEQQKKYEAEKSKFDQAKVRVIVLNFTDPKSKAPTPSLKFPTTEAEAQTKANDLVKQARGGADFAELAKTNSDDKTSGEKGGEYPMIHPGPDPVRTAIFAAKPGDITDPIKQGTSFYIIKVEERSTEPFAAVQQQIISELKQQQSQQWISDLQKRYQVTVQDQQFFAPRAAK